MATFKYSGVSSSGAPVNGVVEAYDSFDAINKIKQECPVVSKLEEVRGKGIDNTLFQTKVTTKELALVCNQFSIILTAGLPLVHTVELVGEQSDSKAVRRLLHQVREDVAAGYTLANSFEKHGHELPTTFVETVRAGEESGNLDTAFARLSVYLTKQNKTKQKVTSALIYPAFVLVVAVAVVGVIMVVAVPTFASMFASSGRELPVLTQVMINTSNFLRNNILIILAVLAILFGGIKLWGKTEKGKLFFARLGLLIPVVGRVSTMNGASQFANTMSTMLAAGLNMTKAIEITGRAMSNYLLGQEVQESIQGIESGRRLADCLSRTKYLPNLMVEMTAVGEETGSLESTLDVVGKYYDNEVEVATARALGLLEPLIIVLLAGFVVVLMLAIYIPMFSMYDGI